MSEIKLNKGETIWAIRHDRTRKGSGMKWYFLFLRRGDDVIDVTTDIADKLELRKSLRNADAQESRVALMTYGTIEHSISELSKKLFRRKKALLVKYAVLTQPPWNKLDITGGKGRGGESRNIRK